MSKYNEEIMIIKNIAKGSVIMSINRRNKKFIKADIAIPKKKIRCWANLEFHPHS